MGRFPKNESNRVMISSRMPCNLLLGNVLRDAMCIVMLPGVTSVTWDVEIVADNLEENNEKFRVLLKSPVNAVLGSRDKATVQIVNLHHGNTHTLSQN